VTRATPTAVVPTSSAPETSQPKPASAQRRKQKSKRPGAGLNGSAEGKRKASVVLEVLGGLRSPTSASVALGISIQAYYLLEIRALQGLLNAVDATPGKGGRPSTGGGLSRLIAERDRLERELLHAHALLRVAQRAMGLPPADGARTNKTAKAKDKRKRPKVRGRYAAQALRDAASESTSTEADVTSAPVIG
jgi:hypothetical protein